MQITVDRDRCLGTGQCVRVAAEVFGQDQDDGLVVVLDADPTKELQGKVLLAESMCPVAAISVRVSDPDPATTATE